MTTTVLLAVLFGVLIGVLLGLVGGGGSILTVPILVYALGENVHAATVMSLIIVGVTAGAGAISHARAGRVSIRTAVLFAGVGIAGTFAGAAANQRVDGAVVLLLFGLMMLGVAVRLLLHRRSGPDEGAAAEAAPAWLVAASGVAVGLLTGFFGVGGGFLIVPALLFLLRFPMRLAIGTSLVVIALNSAVAVLAHGGELPAIDLPVVLLFIAGGFVGSALGSRLHGVVNDLWLSRGFAALVASVGLFLIVQNLPVLS